MQFIILDLEWDSGFYPPEHRFLNQILQIGAVKLDSGFRVADTFEATVRSSFTRRVTGRFSKLTGITTEKMMAGIPLGRAVEQYNEWIGPDTVTMTWSTSDLFTVLENEKYLLDGKKFRIEKYLDLQEYIQNEMKRIGKECKSQIALGDAAAALGVSTEPFSLHTAKDDSLVCMALLKKFYSPERFSALIHDTANPEFYRRLCFKPYYINDLNSGYVDRGQLNFLCEKCGAPLKRTSKWRFFNRNFAAKFCCGACNTEYDGWVSFKKTYDRVVVKRRLRERIKQDSEAESHEMQPVSEKL